MKSDDEETPERASNTDDDGNCLCQRCGNEADLLAEEGLSGSLVVWCRDCYDEFEPWKAPLSRVNQNLSPGYGREANHPALRWEDKAHENIDKWGLQDLETLLLATQEELGELTQATLEVRDEGGDPDRIQDELDDMGALMYQLQWALNQRGDA